MKTRRSSSARRARIQAVGEEAQGLEVLVAVALEIHRDPDRLAAPQRRGEHGRLDQIAPELGKDPPPGALAHAVPRPPDALQEDVRAFTSWSRM